jgi:hypothetical protein
LLFVTAAAQNTALQEHDIVKRTSRHFMKLNYCKLIVATVSDRSHYFPYNSKDALLGHLGREPGLMGSFQCQSHLQEKGYRPDLICF